MRRLRTTASRRRRCRRWRGARKAGRSGACCAATSTISDCACAACISIEEHVPLSVLYKQFFAGELEVLCSLPEFWRKVSIIYSGGDDFAVYGSWDALIALAREVQRLFHRFTEENLKEYPGAEGKTISMAIALAPGDVLSAGGGLRGGRPQSGPGQSGGQGLHLPARPDSGMAALERCRGAEGHGHAADARFPDVAAVPVSVAEFLPPRSVRRERRAMRSARGAFSAASTAFSAARATASFRSCAPT